VNNPEKWLAKAGTKVIREIHIPDTHTPHCEWWDWVVGCISDYQPHVVRHLGDWRECSALSDHPTDDTHTQRDENAEVANQSRQLRGVLPPGTLLVHHEGNHGQRTRRGSARIRDLLDWSVCPELAPEWEHWHHLPYEFSPKGIFVLGNVASAHGFGGSEDTQAINMWNIMGWKGPQMLSSLGHTHRQCEPTQLRKSIACKLPVWRVNGGTLGPTNPGFAATSYTNEWLPGLVWVEHRLDGSELHAGLFTP
jgi:hypothetical protein